MTDSLVFSVNQHGEIPSLDAAEREAAAVLAAIAESKLSRANTQIPMSLSIALSEIFQTEVRRRRFSLGIPYHDALELARLDYPCVFAVSVMPRCPDTSGAALCVAEVKAA